MGASRGTPRVRDVPRCQPIIITHFAGLAEQIMPEGYLPILVMVVVAFGFAAIALIVSALLGPKRHNPAKHEPYESGILPFGDAKRRFPVQFYVVAVLFILFDVEVILMYPWAVAARKLGLFGLIEMAIFVVILMVGFVYAWKNDAFKWQ
jgi:NADH-quinone oxidoreductase subunit A